jgi:hypothetical protein
MDAGYGTNFTKVEAYTGNQFLFTLSTGLTTGKIYGF